MLSNFNILRQNNLKNLWRCTTWSYLYA